MGGFTEFEEQEYISLDETLLEVLEPGDVVYLRQKRVETKHPFPAWMGELEATISSYPIQSKDGIKLEVHLSEPFADGPFTWTESIISFEDWEVNALVGSELEERLNRYLGGADLADIAEEVDLNEVLAPLKEVVLPSDIMRRVLIETSVPQVLNGEAPKHAGIILWGPGGTGKTTMAGAIMQVYEGMGCHVRELSVAELTGSTVGSLERNIDKACQDALQEAYKSGKPSLVVFDEAGHLFQKAGIGSFSTSKYWQGAIEALKRVIGNYEELVCIVTTNDKPEALDARLTRRGRLAVQQIDYPDKDGLKKLWNMFTTEYTILEDELSEEQLGKLGALEAPKGYNMDGGFIADVCKTYHQDRESELVMQGCEDPIQGLIRGSGIASGEMVGVTFERFYEHVQEQMDKHYSSLNEAASKNTIGFKLSG